MKARKRLSVMILLFALALSLCACRAAVAPPQAETPSPLAPYAGTYGFYCAWMSPDYMDALFIERGCMANAVEKTYVLPDIMRDYTITLNADGTGYLFWGEGNQGPVDWWTLDGEALQFKAGVAVFDGSIVDGFMTVSSEPGFELYFSLPGATVPELSPVSMDEYLDMLYTKEETPPTQENMAGMYYPYAEEKDAYRVRLSDFAQTAEGSVNLKEDGTGVMIVGGVGNRFSWRLEDGQLHWYDESGTRSMDELLHFEILRSGVFIMRHVKQETVSIYARTDADVSALETVTEEEFRALTGRD